MTKSAAQAVTSPTTEVVRARLLEAETKNQVEHKVQTADELRLAKERMAALKEGKQEHDFKKKYLHMKKMQIYQLLKSQRMFSSQQQKSVYLLATNNSSKESFIDFLISNKHHKC